jgi:hypothetical protein
MISARWTRAGSGRAGDATGGPIGARPGTNLGRHRRWAGSIRHRTVAAAFSPASKASPSPTATSPCFDLQRPDLNPQWPNSLGNVISCRSGMELAVPACGSLAMRFSSLLSPAVASTSIALLLCGQSGTAISQTATGSAPLPSITVDAPKQVARPRRPEHVANTVSSRRTSPTVQASSSVSHVPSGPPGSVLGRLGKLEKSASSCNGGCETSFKTGNAPWVGCSYSGGWWSTFSTTCTDTLTYTNYSNCLETKLFLGWEHYKARWICNGLAAGGKFRVAELKQSRHPH